MGMGAAGGWEVEKVAPCYSQLLNQTFRTLKRMFVTLIWTLISVTLTTPLPLITRAPRPPTLEFSRSMSYRDSWEMLRLDSSLIYEVRCLS